MRTHMHVIGLVEVPKQQFVGAHALTVGRSGMDALADSASMQLDSFVGANRSFVGVTG